MQKGKQQEQEYLSKKGKSVCYIVETRKFLDIFRYTENF